MTIAWTEAYARFFPTGIGWQDYDIFTNLGVPKGAVAEIICANGNDSADRLLGVRTDGSSLERWGRIHEAEAGGETHITMLVTVHATTGLIETYCDSTTGVTFYLMGYWTGVTFTERTDSIWVYHPVGWWDYDLYMLFGVPKGSVVQVFCMHYDVDTAYELGVRAVGSSLERKILVHEAEGVTVRRFNGYGTFVKTSPATGGIEVYSPALDLYFYYMIYGYFDVTMDYVERWSQKAIADNAWVDVDLSADLDEDGRIVNFVLTHNNRTTEKYLGARTDGSALLRYLLEHEAEINGYTGFGVTVKSADATGIVELFATSDDYFWLAGYFKSAPAYRMPVSTIRVRPEVLVKRNARVIGTRDSQTMWTPPRPLMSVSPESGKVQVSTVMQQRMRMKPMWELTIKRNENLIYHKKRTRDLFVWRGQSIFAYLLSQGAVGTWTSAWYVVASENSTAPDMGDDSGNPDANEFSPLIGTPVAVTYEFEPTVKPSGWGQTYAILTIKGTVTSDGAKTLRKIGIRDITAIPNRRIIVEDLVVPFGVILNDKIEISYTVQLG